jgi:oligosaccharide 4-alpha-D-glucosyltransferase
MDEELYTRWLQFAVFTPILRPHGSNHPSEPVFWSEKTQDIVRKYMKLRYELLPYNYTLAWQNAGSGAPLMRPLFYNYPDDTNTRRISGEYLWGDGMLVAPVIKKGEASKRIYLPSGTWYDFNTDAIHAGNAWIDYPLSIENIPVFVKAGSFIPATRPVNTTDEYTSDNFEVRYYPEGNSAFTQYEDDGKDKLAIKDKQFELIHYSGSESASNTTISIRKEGSWKGMPVSRRMTLKVKTDASPSAITLNNREVIRSVEAKAPGLMNSHYNYQGGWITIHFEWNGSPVSIKIRK